MQPDPPGEELPVLEGPDPREWPVRAPRLWSLMLDIEHIRRVREAMKGPVSPESGSAYAEACRFLDQAEEMTRGSLSAAVLDTYAVPLPDEAKSVFGAAGKPRAYGAEPPSPPAAAT